MPTRHVRSAGGTLVTPGGLFVSRVTQPLHEENVGWTSRPGATSLTPWGGASTVTVSTPGTSFVGIDFGSTFFNVRCADVTFSGCRWINTVVPGAARWQIDAGAGCENLRVEHCTAANLATTHLLGAFVGGHDYTTFRNDVTGYLDGYTSYNANVPAAERHDIPVNVIHEADFIGEFQYLYSDTIGVVHPSDYETHNEAHQPQGGVGAQTVGCTLAGDYSTVVGYFGPMRPETRYAGQANAARGGALSCYTLTESVARVSGLVIEDNWVLGGNYGLNLGSNPQAPGTNLGRVWRNRFDRRQFSQPNGIPATIVLDANLVCDTGDGTANANVYLDNGAEVLVRRNY